MSHVIELFLSEHCPSCPEARRRVQQFARFRPDVTVVERNVDEAPALATRYGLFATPAVVVNQRGVLYGVPSLARLQEAVGLLGPPG